MYDHSTNMSIPNSAKRRKLDGVSNTLNKPFVSPLRARKPQTPLKENTNKVNIDHQLYAPSTLAHTVKTAEALPDTITPDPAFQLCRPSPEKAIPTRKQPFSSWSSAQKSDPEILAAQKAISSLELQIRKVQNDLDTLKQAGKLSSSSTDSHVEALTEKWRTASQAVADELFGQVKERVQRMGGVAAWREMEHKKHDRQNGLGEFSQQPGEESDYEDCEFDSEGEELPEEEQIWRKKMKKQAKKEMFEAADTPGEHETEAGEGKTKVWQEDGKDDDSFTMDMMLRSLNIDLNVVGYDKETQRWI